MLSLRPLPSLLGSRLQRFWDLLILVVDGREPEEDPAASSDVKKASIILQGRQEETSGEGEAVSVARPGRRGADERLSETSCRR